MKCIQNTDAMVKERNLDNEVISLRLRGADAARFWRVMDLAKERNPYADRSNVIRELIGLDNPTLLTSSEIQFFRTGKKHIVPGSELAPRSKQPVLMKKEPEQKEKRKVG